MDVKCKNRSIEIKKVDTENRYKKQIQKIDTENRYKGIETVK